MYTHIFVCECVFACASKPHTIFDSSLVRINSFQTCLKYGCLCFMKVTYDGLPLTTCVACLSLVIVCPASAKRCSFTLYSQVSKYDNKQARRNARFFNAISHTFKINASTCPTVPNPYPLRSLRSHCRKSALFFPCVEFALHLGLLGSFAISLALARKHRIRT